MNIILMMHVGFGVICLLSTLWVFVETIHVAPAHLARIRFASWVSAGAMWIAYIIAGYWYISFYPRDKALILKGPWPASHSFFMESKEHFVILLLLAATYLPIATSDDLVHKPDARRLVLGTAGLVFGLALGADFFGAIVGMGVKAALLPG